MCRTLTVGLVFLVAAVLAAVMPGTDDAEAKGNLTVISGGDLPHAVTMPFEDSFTFSYPRSAMVPWDQFSGWPRALDTGPRDLGRGYEVTSGLWGEMVYSLGLTLVQSTEQRIDTTYFPDQQVAEVRVEPGGVQLWVELDDGRAALIGRYIELGRAGLLSEEPSILDVFAAERRLNGAGTPVEVDGRALMPDEIAAFWNIVASEDWPEIAVTISRAGAKPYTGEAAASDERFEAMVYGYPEFTRLIFTAPDGRHVELAYYQVTSVIVGMPMAWANAPSGRGFKVPEAVAGSFALALGVEPPAIEPSTVGVSDGSTGSVQVGRGRASNVVAAAVVGVGVLAALATAGALVRAGRMTQA